MGLNSASGAIEAAPSILCTPDASDDGEKADKMLLR
jgi:hypothetical protein